MKKEMNTCNWERSTAGNQTLCYLDLSATSVEGDDTDDVSAVGVCLEAAHSLAGVNEPQMFLVESGECRLLNLHCHCGLIADHIGFN